MFAASEKSQMEKMAYDLSQILWRDTGRHMFDVVVLTDKNNTKLNAKLHSHLKSYEVDFDHGILLKDNNLDFSL